MKTERRGSTALVAAALVNLPIGTIYAFSVFLRPVEALLGTARAEMSFVFALATITLTAGMNVAPLLYRRVPPLTLALASGAASAAGLLLAGTATSFAQFAIGYGVVFGPGAGVLFIIAQQAVNQTVARSRGLANGYVVSLLPLGAMLGAPVLAWAIQAYGVRSALTGVGAAVLGGAMLAGALYRATNIRLVDTAVAADATGASLGRTFFLLTAVFFLAAAAGLMVLSQASAIVEAYGGSTALAVGATTVITGAVGAARIAGGWLVDRFGAAASGVGAHAFSLAGAVALVAVPAPVVAAIALFMIGFGYGIVSGLAAGAIAQYWHRNRFGAIASRLYIAWCTAAVTLPVVAGWLFDRTASYTAAVWIAGGINVLGAFLASRLPRHGG